MAITAWFTSYDGDPSTVNKGLNFTGEGTTINAWDQIDDLTCDFIMDGAGYHASNMMKVSWSGTIKYYFIEQRTGMPGTRTKIRATCDVLYTYAETIKNSPAVINRTQYGETGLTNPFLKDNRTTTLAETEFSSNKLASNIIDNVEYVYVGILQKVPSTAATP